MMFRSCPHETELAAVLKAGHWPEACDEGLRAHVRECRSCSDFVLVTLSFQRARSQSMQAAPVDSPSLLWWRASLRRRNAAVARISRPISLAGTFGLLSTLAVALAFVWSQWRSGASWLPWLTALPHPSAFGLRELWSAVYAQEVNTLGVLTLAAGLALITLLGGFVMYLATGKE